MRTISSLVKARRSTRRSKMTKWLRSPCILMKGRSLAPCLSFPLFIFVNTFIVPTIEYRTALRPPGLVAQARRNVSPQRAEQEVCRAAGFLVLRNVRYIRLRICLSRAPDAGIGTPCRDHRGEGAALTEESMKDREFREWSRRAADWGADYRASLRERPVRPRIEPGTVFHSLESAPPERAESMEAIFADFEQKIVPGMTHWQHPRFFA